MDGGLAVFSILIPAGDQNLRPSTWPEPSTPSGFTSSVSLGGGAKMRAWQIIDSAVSELELEIR